MVTDKDSNTWKITKHGENQTQKTDKEWVKSIWDTTNFPNGSSPANVEDIPDLDKFATAPKRMLGHEVLRGSAGSTKLQSTPVKKAEQHQWESCHLAWSSCWLSIKGSFFFILK